MAVKSQYSLFSLLIILLKKIFSLILRMVPKKIKILYQYKRRFNKWCNFSNPKRYTEYMQWLKLYGNLKVLAKYADKYTVRKIVESQIGAKYLVPLIGAWGKVEDIDWESLPDSFILKCSHGSGYNILVKDKNRISRTEISMRLKKWMQINFYKINDEPQYKQCIPMVIAEQLIVDSDGDLKDYKVFCFDGSPMYIQVDVNRTTNHERCFYDLNWVKQPFTTQYPFFNGEVEKPIVLNEMLELSKSLSNPFQHVRVDFYCISDRIFFGELTFTHGNGFEIFYPDEWDYRLGSYMKKVSYE